MLLFVLVIYEIVAVVLGESSAQLPVGQMVMMPSDGDPLFGGDAEEQLVTSPPMVFLCNAALLHHLAHVNADGDYVLGCHIPPRRHHWRSSDPVASELHGVAALVPWKVGIVVLHFYCVCYSWLYHNSP